MWTNVNDISVARYRPELVKAFEAGYHAGHFSNTFQDLADLLDNIDGWREYATDKEMRNEIIRLMHNFRNSHTASGKVMARILEKTLNKRKKSVIRVGTTVVTFEA